MSQDERCRTLSYPRTLRFFYLMCDVVLARYTETEVCKLDINWWNLIIEDNRKVCAEVKALCVEVDRGVNDFDIFLRWLLRFYPNLECLYLKQSWSDAPVTVEMLHRFFDNTKYLKTLIIEDIESDQLRKLLVREWEPGRFVMTNGFVHVNTIFEVPYPDHPAHVRTMLVFQPQYLHQFHRAA